MDDFPNEAKIEREREEFNLHGSGTILSASEHYEERNMSDYSHLPITWFVSFHLVVQAQE